MARPTKSTAELKASGTFKPERHASRVENHGESIQTLPAPKHYDKEHLAKWEEVVGDLARYGILKKQDFDAICIYVETTIFQRMAWREFQKTKLMVVEVETKSGTVSKINPAYTAYLNADRILKPLREKFAFTPKDRQSVHVVDKSEKKTDPLKALMGSVQPKTKTG